MDVLSGGHMAIGHKLGATIYAIEDLKKILFRHWANGPVVRFSTISNLYVTAA